MGAASTWIQITRIQIFRPTLPSLGKLLHQGMSGKDSPSYILPTNMKEVSVSASPLLSLPGHLLALVVSSVQGGKNGLRSTCRSLRLAVNDCTSALAWTRPRGLDGGPVLHAHLPASLTGACPGIKLVARKIPSWSPALRPVPRPFTPCSAASPRFSCWPRWQ